jgi:hypothetical protein
VDYEPLSWGYVVADDETTEKGGISRSLEFRQTLIHLQEEMKLYSRNFDGSK